MMFWSFINPSSPNINIQILQTDLHTFPLRISWKNLINDQVIFSLVIIILLILLTFSLDNVWKLLGENCLITSTSKSKNNVFWSALQWLVSKHFILFRAENHSYKT